MKKILTQSTVIAVVLALAACSATPVRRSAKETWTDTLTASKIRYKLMRDSNVKKSHMHVEVFRGDVTLTGRAVNEAEKDRAETLAKTVRHVTTVENYIHVVSGDNAPALARRDAAPAAPAVTATQHAASTAKTAPGIQEQTLTQDVSVAKVPAGNVRTIRETTGERRPAVARPVVAARKATKRAPKAVAKATAKHHPISKATLEAAKKIPTVETKAAASQSTAVQTATKSPVAAPAAPVASESQTVGRSKTGLPWDGEVYNDDAYSMKSSQNSSSTATRTTTKTQNSGDDLAKEAAQELQKLQSSSKPANK